MIIVLSLIIMISGCAVGKKDLPVTGEKDATLDQAITLDIIVARGRYALYSVGKTPTSQAVYDTNQHIARVLCLGDGAGSESD